MNPNNISNHFTWHEALFLPSWNREANDTDGLTPIIKTNLVVLFSKMDQIRDHFNNEIIVHVAYRPILYNELIHGAEHSQHTEGKAVDFHIVTLNCDNVRQEILNNDFLNKLGLRMEDNPNSNWVHLDIGNVINSRYFKP